MRFVADLNCAMTKEKRGDINLLELKDEDNPKFNEFIDSATYPKKKIKKNMGEDGNKIAIKNTLVMNMA